MMDSLKDKVERIDNERTQTGIYRAIRTLATHHLAEVMKKLMLYDYPYATFVTEIWHTLVTDEKLAPPIFEKLLQLLSTGRPYDETAKGTRTPSLAVMKATTAIKEIMTVEDSQKVVEANFSRICASLIVRIGCTAGIKKEGNLDPNEDSVSCFKVFVQASKSPFIETAMQEGGGVSFFSMFFHVFYYFFFLLFFFFFFPSSSLC